MKAVFCIFAVLLAVLALSAQGMQVDATSEMAPVEYVNAEEVEFLEVHDPEISQLEEESFLELSVEGDAKTKKHKKGSEKKNQKCW